MYEYSAPAAYSLNEVRLLPSSDASQTLLDYSLDVAPKAKVFRYETTGGTVQTFGVRTPHTVLDVLVQARVETLVDNPFADLQLLDDDWAELEPFRAAHAEYLAPSPMVPHHPGASALARAVRRPGQSVAVYLTGLNNHLARMLRYDADATHVHTTLAEILDLKAGVCQDFAHLMLACLRSVGVPARYVSGYLFVEEGSGMQGEQGSHAWVEAMLPDGRWLGLDPTNNLLANDRYVRVHHGRDYGDCSPVKGIYRGPGARMTVEVSVVRDVAARPPLGER